MNQENNVEIKKESIFKKAWVQSLISVFIIFSVLFIFLFWQSIRNTVYIENSHLEAPIINLSPTVPGVLNALYVKENDKVLANTQIALVGSQIIYTKNDGIVSYAPSVLGAYFSLGQIVASVVNEEEMKVVGEVEETKGLSEIAKGQSVVFSVDAFPGKTYSGVVDEVSPTSVETGVVFSISDKRPIKKFNVKVKFNVSDYPELKNGMSAKITVYTR